jgi:hypothetical protein
MTLEPKAGRERTMAQKTTMAPEATAPEQQCQNSSAKTTTAPGFHRAPW